MRHTLACMQLLEWSGDSTIPCFFDNNDTIITSLHKYYELFLSVLVTQFGRTSAQKAIRIE